MTTLMKQRRQIRALARLPSDPYSKLPKRPTKDEVKKADRIADERSHLIRRTSGVDRLALATRLNRII